MSATIDQKAYLRKYLAGPSGDKKKKKKKVVKGKGFKIIDDDIDLSKLRALDGDELDILGEGEDAPQIAGIIDERPEEVKKLEQFKTNSKWRVINQDDGFNSKLQIEEIKTDIKEVEKENELVFGKMYSDSEDEKKESNQSPTRQNIKTTKKSQNHSDSDFSPPRKDKKERNKDNNSDISPPRRNDQKIWQRNKPSRWERGTSHNDKSQTTREDKSDSDASPPRKTQRNSSPVPRSKKESRRLDSDVSPVRKAPKNSELSPRRSKKEASRKRSDSDVSPRKTHKNSDLSPRRSKKDTSRRSDDASRKRGHERSMSSDLSPPRKSKRSPYRKIEHSRNDRNSYRDRNDVQKKENRNQSDFDESPPRREIDMKKRDSNKERREGKRDVRRQDSDSDLSPPRRHDRNARNDSPPPSNKKMARTLEGKKAGLQDAAQLRDENASFRRREDEAFSRLADEVSGRNAQVVSRKGKRETSEDRRKQKEKSERQKDLDEKYKKWSKGLKQIEAQEARMQDFMQEAAKPLARYKDDRDLEDRLKDVERAGDPMLQYIKEKKRDRGELPPEKPKYKGNFPPNRFNIRPGYRWDGVDRSNGYEKKVFEHQSKRRAQEEEAYKWSTEDL